jgi:type I restriction enzyme R subunit
MKGQRPIIFFTNGFETYIWDDVWYPAREVQGFYSKEELELLIQRRTTRLSLTAAHVDANIADRYYQIEAIRSVARVLENNGRDALLVMATGTGKTRTAAALVDVLSKSNWAKRTLFLADRSALVHQAKKAFVNLLPNLPAIDLTKEKDSLHARVVFSTYQTLINLIDNEYDEDKRHFGVGHFDLIIFDEIHRSVYNKYRAIFQYFDGYRIGLTATPKSEGDRDTYHLFGLEPNVPTFAYELDQAVMDKFLVPPFKISVPVKFHREGIKYADLTLEEKLNYEETFRDPITETLPDEISSAALNKWLFNESTVDQVLSYLMTRGIKVAGGDRLGKTIIFARSHQHAEFIKLRFDKQYPHFGGHFCSVIDIYEGSKYAFDLIEKFSQKDSYPHIAISVDMMDTGIDIPECVNLVFYKPVKSRTKFWQMIGRGTRLCKDLFGPSQDKDKFIIFDFCENFEFFDFNPEGVKDSKVRSLTERLFHQRLKLLFLLQRKQEESLASYADELAAYMHQQVNRLEEENFVVRQHWRFVEKYRDAFQWNALTELDLKELLDHLAPIVSEKDDDERSKSFDVLCYALQIEVVQRGSVSASLMDQVITLMGQLSKKGSIPAVAARMSLIKEVQLKQYWAEPTVPKFEHLRKELRSLIRYIDKEKGVIYHTNFTDEILSFVEEPSPVSATMDLETYKRRVTEYLERNRHHVTIHKLRTNQPISNSELRSLEAMLFEQGDIGTRDHFVRAYGDQPLGTFIRTILGLDIEAANQAFSGFINNPSLNASQIRFVNLLIQYLTTNGVITAERLFQPPFTDISTNGLLGVFQGREAETIVRTIDSINQMAVGQ